KLLMQRKADEYEELLRKNQKPSTFNFNQFKFLISSGVSDYETLIKQYHSLTQDAQKNGMHIVPSLCQENCQKAASSMIKKLDPSLIKKKLQNSLKELNVEDRIAMCKASFISAHVTNKKKDEFSKLWPEIKKNFDQNVFSRFSA